MKSASPRGPGRPLSALITLVAVLVQGVAVVRSTAVAEDAPQTDAVATPTPAATPSAPEKDLRSIFDPTVVRRRVGLEDELIDLEGTAWTNRTELSGVTAIGPTENFDVAFGLVVPLVYFASEEPPGRQDEFGLGDLELSTGLVLKHSPWFSHAAAFEVKFPTATDDLLGGNAINLKPYYVASLRPFSFLGSVFEVDYNDSVSEENGVAESRSLELNPSVNLTYPEEWLYFVRVQYKGQVFYEPNDEYTNRMEVSVGKIIGDAKQISVYFALEFPLDNDMDQHSGKIGITYFFD